MIETLTDWNTRLGYCGCCEMPSCPIPKRFYSFKTGIGGRCSLDMWNEINDSPSPSCENLRGTWSSAVRVITEEIPGEDTYVSTRTATISRTGANQDCSGGGVEYDGYPTNYEAFATRISRVWSGSTLTEVWEYVNTAPDPDETSTFTLVETYSGFLSEEDALAATLNNATLNTEADTWTDESEGIGYAKHTAFINNYLTGTCPPVGVVDRIDLVKTRVRFRIPTTHTGSYFKITYDIAEFPEDGDPSFISQDNVIEWTGPGTGEQSDPSWLAGDWVEIDPPEVPGQRRIVNIRYTCYAGTKFGVRPQVEGESLEIPPP
jgi:hypothetical protein